MKRIDSIPMGYSTVEAGTKVAPTQFTASTGTALSVSINAEIIHITAWNTNTSTIWMGFDSSTTSGTGYPLFSGSVIDLRYREMPLYFQSASGSAVVSYIALGKGS